MQGTAKKNPPEFQQNETSGFENLLKLFVKKGGKITPKGLLISFSLGTNVQELQSIADELRSSEEGKAYVMQIQAELSAPKKLKLLQ